MRKQGTETAERAKGWDRGFRRILGWMAISSLTLSAAIGLFVILVRPNWQYEGQLLGTVSLFGASASLALACVWSREVLTKRRLWTAGLLMGASLAMFGWISALPLIWNFESFLFGSDAGFELLGRACVIAYILSGAITYVGLFSLMRVRSWASTIRFAGCCAILVVAGTLTTGVVLDRMSDFLIRAMSSTAIIAGVSVAIVPVLAAVFPAMRIRRDEARPGELSIDLACPVCAHRQRIPLHRRVECAGCGLGIDLRLDAPRCACGYDLAGLTMTTCPECGAEVPKRHSWALSMKHEEG